MNRIRVAGLGWIALALVLVNPATAGEDYEQGYESYLGGNYQIALHIWHSLAEKADVRAQFGLATLYYEGQGVAQDFVESAHWFSLAAEQGYAPAQFNLGNAYKSGNGVEQNEATANHWWLLAGEQEFAPAQYNLGTQYYFGRGVSPNESAAFRWYRRAADNGHAKAIEILAKSDHPEAHAQSPESAVETSAVDHTEQQVEVADVQLPSTTEGPTGVRDNGWVQTQHEDAFTVQLVAGQNLAAVEAVVAEKHLAPNAALIQFSKNGALWYAIVYGSYPDRDAAASAVANFPSTLKSFKPWIRSFASIKKILQ